MGNNRKALPVFWCVDDEIRKKLDPKPAPKPEWVEWKQEMSHRPLIKRVE